MRVTSRTAVRMRLGKGLSLDSCSLGLRFPDMRTMIFSKANHWRRPGLAAVMALAAAGCDGAGRFADFGGSRQAVAPPPRVQTFTPAPMAGSRPRRCPPVGGMQPLPPPSGPNPELGGLPSRTEGASPTPGLPPAGGSIPIDPEPVRPVQRPVEPPPVVEPPQRTASRPSRRRPRPRRRRAPASSATGARARRRAAAAA